MMAIVDLIIIIIIIITIIIIIIIKVYYGISIEWLFTRVN